MSTYRVTSSQLNIRSAPLSRSDKNIITTLPNGHVVEKVADAIPGWWAVRTRLNGVDLNGFVCYYHLEAYAPPPPPPQPPIPAIPSVHMPNNASARRNSTAGRANPLNEAGQPSRNTSSVNVAKDSLHTIINWLAVDVSARYSPITTATYCNIYAYDFCYLSGVYLPRVWWTGRALRDIAAGVIVTPQYGNTIHEMNANSLFRWLVEWGDDFGWSRVFSLDDLQNAANTGKVCLITARNRNENNSGHICAVVPENSNHSASRNSNGSIRYPLQSQAGRSNKRYFNNSDWWLGSSMAEFGFFVHD